MNNSIYTYIKIMYDFAEQYPEKIKPYHWALYIASVEKCNRLGWKDKFGLPTDQMMELCGICSRKIYYKARKELEEWKFIRIIQKSVNQSSATVITLLRDEQPQAGNFPNTSATAARPNQVASTAPIIRPYKTIKDFRENSNNRDFLKSLIFENEVLIHFLSEKSNRKDAEKEKIDDFLEEKFSTGENLIWKNESDFLKHYRNWFLKKYSVSEARNNLQKAERR